MIAGAYTLRPHANPAVTIVAMGALVTEAVAAADRLTEIGVDVEVICITSPSLLFEAKQARAGHGTGSSWILYQVFPANKAAPIVTVLDGHSNALSFLPAINRVPSTALGVVRVRSGRVTPRRLSLPRHRCRFDHPGGPRRAPIRPDVREKLHH